MESRDKLIIVMPAYNEQDNIEQVVNQWYPVVEAIGNDSILIVVNDGSRDDTSQCLHRIQAQYPHLVPIDKLNSGHGATCLFAYREAIRAGADYIFQTDSDGQTSPDEFLKFWENRHQYDFIIGLRNSRQDGISRVFISNILRVLVWGMLGEWVPDANTPFRLMRVTALVEVLQYIPENFFLSNVAICAIALRKKKKCVWYPITFKPRQGGVNSINYKRIFEIGWKAIGDFRIIRKNIKE